MTNKTAPSPLKDGGVLAAWAAGLLIVGALLWFFTQPLRSQVLLRTVNGILMSAGDERRLAAPLPAPEGAPLGYWFSRTGPGRAVVFPVIDQGTLGATLAFISPQGGLEDLISLSGHGEAVLTAQPRGLLRIYLRRLGVNP